MIELYQKLANIRKLTEVVQKTARGFNYTYVPIQEILARVTAGMKKYNISLYPRLIPGSETVVPYSYTKTKTTKDGKIFDETVSEILVKAQYIYTWVDNETGAFIEVPWLITGSQQDPSQALGSGLTYGLRQFLTQYFQVAQPNDDPDNWRSKQKEVEESENREIAKMIIDQVHTMVSEYIATHEDDRQKICDITKKYAKDSKGKSSANYNLITDPIAASKLLEELSALCGVKADE